MRLLGLTLRAYGRFTEVALDFGADRGFTMVYGSNEAGKSTTLRAITGLLYGIAGNTQDDFLHRAPELRISGDVQAGGAVARFIRRKGNKDTLLDETGKPLPDQAIEPFLGGVDRDLFTTLYGLNHETLRRGGDDICKGKGDLAQTLFQAATGLVGVRDRLDALEREASALWTPRSREKPLDAKFARVNALQKEISDKSLSSTKYMADRKDLRETIKARDHVRNERIALSSRLSRLNNLALAEPQVQELSRCQETLKQLGDVIELKENQSRIRERLQNTLHTERDNALKRHNELEILNTSLKGISVQPELIDLRSQVANLQNDRGSYIKAVKIDLPKVRTEADDLEAEIESILARLGAGIDRPSVERLRLSPRQRRHIDTLAKQHPAILARLADSKESLRNLRLAISGKRAELDRTGNVPDVGILESCLNAARREGDIERTLVSASAEAAAAQIRVEAARLALHPIALDLEHERSLQIPLVETVEKFEELFEVQSRDEERAAEKLANLIAQSQRINETIEEFRRQGEIPLEEDLSIARENRSKGWDYVKQAWSSGVSINDPCPEMAPDQPLYRAFEERVIESDRVADQLRNESGRVASLEQMIRQRRELADSLLRSDEEAAVLALRRERLQDDWQAQWKASYLLPLTPKEMRTWLANLAEVRRVLEQDDKARKAVEDLKQHADKTSETLRVLLGPIQDSSMVQGLTLNSMLEYAEGLVRKAKKKADDKAILQQSISDLENTLALGELTAADLRSQLQSWELQWSEGVAPLGLPVSPAPDQAPELLEYLSDIFNKIDSSQKLHIRISAMIADGEVFKTKLLHVSEAIAPELVGWSPEDTVSELDLRLKQALENQAKKDEQTRRLDECRIELRQHEAARTAAQDELDRMIAAAQCLNIEELVSAEQKSAEANELVKKVRALMSGLASFARGSDSLEALVQDVLAIPPEDRATQIGELEAEIDRMLAEEARLAKAEGEIEERLRFATGGSDAADAAQALQEAIADATNEAERYVKLRLASVLLRQAIEGFADRNQDPVLARAGSIFSRLTLGSFAGLSTDYEKDSPVILGVRPTGSQIPVNGMSDGTVDPLYLALRLASLEERLMHSEPLPLILDDALVHFDDDRARATLQVLIELSAKTQVLFFTHHRRMVELLAEAGPTTAYNVVELPLLNQGFVAPARSSVIIGN